jgi:hypothetical protein
LKAVDGELEGSIETAFRKFTEALHTRHIFVDSSSSSFFELGDIERQDPFFEAQGFIISAALKLAALIFGCRETNNHLPEV